MFRKKFVFLTTGLALVALPCSVLAADYPGDDYPTDLRGSYDWTNSQDGESPVGFEFGLRYVYSKGERSFSIGNTKETSHDTTHILEGDLRIDDYTTSSFLRGTVGHSVAISGDYGGDWGNGTIVDGTVGYFTTDFGQYWIGDPRDGFGVGGFIGYQYLYDNPDIGRSNFTTARSANDITWNPANTDWTVPYDSKPNALNMHMLRLGASGRAELNDMFDISLDVAAIPYTSITGTMGAYGIATTGTNPTYIQASPEEVNGWGYGGAADLAVGFHPFENMVIRLGGRAQYLEGTYDATHAVASITDQTNLDGDAVYENSPNFAEQYYVTTDNPFSMWRVSGFLELGGKF